MPSFGSLPASLSAGAFEAAPTCCRFAFISLLTHRLLGLTRFTDAPHSKAPSRERYPPWFSSVPSNVTRVLEEPAGTCTLLPATFMVETGLGAACRGTRRVWSPSVSLIRPDSEAINCRACSGTKVLPVFRSMEDWVFSIAGSIVFSKRAGSIVTFTWKFFFSPGCTVMLEGIENSTPGISVLPA